MGDNLEKTQIEWHHRPPRYNKTGMAQEELRRSGMEGEPNAKKENYIFSHSDGYFDMACLYDLPVTSGWKTFMGDKQ